MAARVQHSTGSPLARSSATAAPRPASGSSQQQRPRRVVVRRSSRVLHGDHGHGDHTTPWFKKHPELWGELDSKAARDAALAALPPGKLLVVDYYAPSCAVCKTAFPAVSRVAAAPAFTANYAFVKASLEHAEVKEWVKAEGITGIPHLSVYAPDGTKLLGMGASFKKMEAVKHNLAVIAEQRDAVLAAGRTLTLDPNAFVVIDGVSMAPAAAATTK